MQEIDHAIHTSAKTECNEGYQIVAKSSGIGAADARELAAWCPSHGSLLPDATMSGGVSAFRLANGSRYVARTLVVGSEYSNRGGPQLVTHCLKAPKSLLQRFANNPFALLNAVAAGGRLDPSSAPKRSLEPFPLVGRAKAFNPDLLCDAERQLGRIRLIQLLHFCCSAETVGIAGGQEPATWMATVLNLLPVATRPDATFTAGLHPTPCRPVRWISIDGGDAQQCRKLKRDGVCIVDCRPIGIETVSADDGRESLKTEWAGWAGFVADCLARQRIDVLEAAIENDDAPCSLQELNEYAIGLDRSEACGASGGVQTVPTTTCIDARTPLAEEDSLPSHEVLSTDPSNPFAMHVAADVVRERLELLDDTIFAAINGDSTSLAQSASRWRNVVSALGSELVEESREQYLRYANDVWQSSRDDGRIGPDQTAAALEIIAMLMG